MSRAGIFLAGVAVIALASAPAVAQQEMYPGQNVQVNPAAGGTQVLLYPDGRHVRAVPRLLQPGEKDGPIILHMPVKRRHVVRHVRKTAPQVASVEIQTLPPEAPPPPPPPKKIAAQKPRPAKTPAADPGPAAPVPFQFTALGTPPQNYASQPPSAPQSQAPRPPAGYSRRSQIIFAAGAPLPAPNAIDAIRMLGSDLNSALQGGAQKIELQAYGGPRNDKSSDAHRLALKRAIAIRNILIEAGVPSTKIDVKALGGANAGPLDRVDVYVRT
jgi:hypothetical protein